MKRIIAVGLLFMSFLTVRAHEFPVKGFHVDLRTQVMTIDALKNFATELSEMGINTLCVEVLEGKIRINHGAYTPDGGTWLSAPAGRKAHYDFSSGDKDRIVIDIRESFGKRDMLTVVNVSLFHKAVLRISH